MARTFDSMAFAAAPLVSGEISLRNPACSGGSWSIGGDRLSDTGGTYTQPVEEYVAWSIATSRTSAYREIDQ